MEGSVINLKEKTYEVSKTLLFKDAEELAAVAVRAVSLNGSGGFPARPQKAEMTKRDK